jgi:hypothetical protein
LNALEGVHPGWSELKIAERDFNFSRRAEFNIYIEMIKSRSKYNEVSKRAYHVRRGNRSMKTYRIGIVKEWRGQ